jgi:hypothetical protein
VTVCDLLVSVDKPGFAVSVGRQYVPTHRKKPHRFKAIAQRGGTERDSGEAM